MTPASFLSAVRTRWKRWLLEALLIVGIVVAVQLWQARDLPVGPAPALAGTLVDGRVTSLTDVLETADGRPVLVAFWATWCPVCKAEEGNIDAVARDWPTLTVAMQSGDAAAVAKHLKERELGFTAAVDADGRLASDWKVRGVPTHFIVDGRGNIRFQLVGYATELGLRARLWWAQRFAA
ncbi:thiol-disulfide isomerase/thioredoxin [Sulfurisoma sediminicola]|uniref:Thiol-disulfide isomerase/thioredoxin n=1 Tax=Sulfurisoma sediminicola TaxID=1381557 RepID=A0A497XLF7_9PROT|nr:thiol-disulfide isomerase/thioredoxin [Sulfurisoma sediminicola]